MAGKDAGAGEASERSSRVTARLVPSLLPPALRAYLHVLSSRLKPEQSPENHHSSPMTYNARSRASVIYAVPQDEGITLRQIFHFDTQDHNATTHIIRLLLRLRRYD